jgi:hypothetical protein
VRLLEEVPEVQRFARREARKREVMRMLHVPEVRKILMEAAREAVRLEKKKGGANEAGVFLRRRQPRR